MPAAIAPMFVKRLQGDNSISLEHGQEAATQSWREGAPLVGVAGKLTEVSADPTLSVGLSLYPASGVTDRAVMYVPISRDVIIEISVNAQVTVANTHIAYGIVKVGNYWVLDLTETTATFGRIIEIPLDMVSVDNPRVLVVPTLAIME